MIEVYNPVTYVNEKKSVPIPFDLKGKRVGLLSNGKPNVDLLYDHIAKGLPSQFQTGSIIRSMKASSAQPAPEDILKKLSEQTEVVINAVGD
jgi:hypothetical protein